MPDMYRRLCAEVDIACVAVADATESTGKALKKFVGNDTPLKAIKPTPVVDGTEMPQVIVFTNDPAKSDG